MKVLELFAGAGGAALGLQAAGFQHHQRIEWDADACATMRAAGLEITEADVRDLAAQRDGPDMIWSSFPCQAWSSAGSRKGATDDRNGWPWTLASIDHHRPRWVVMENVRGLTHHARAKGCKAPKGQGIGGEHCPACYLHEVILPALRQRYDYVEHRILNAADYGVPQARHRLFIVAGPAPIAWPAPTHGLVGKPHVSMGEALGLACTIDHSRNTAANPHQERVRPSSEPAPTIGGKGNQMVRIIGGGRNPQTRGVQRTYRDLTDGPSTTICAQVGGGAGNAGPWVVPMTASGGPARASDSLWMATCRRRLTVEECAILQNFPANWPFQGTKASQYRQVGNAVPPALAEAIGRAVLTKEAWLEQHWPLHQE